MEHQIARSMAILFLIIFLFCPLGDKQSAVEGGIVQVTEGEVFLDGNPLQLMKDDVGVMRKGQTLSTKQGRVELILASTNLSLGKNTSLRMEQSEPKGAGLTLREGIILVEVLQKLTGPIKVRISNSTVEINKQGLYRREFSPCHLLVYGGVALAVNGSNRAQIKKDRMVSLDGNLTQSKFDPKTSDALHQWSACKSFDIFLANPETGNWEWKGLPPTHANPYPIGPFMSPNYRMRFEARMPTNRPRLKGVALACPAQRGTGLAQPRSGDRI